MIETYTNIPGFTKSHIHHKRSFFSWFKSEKNDVLKPKPKPEMSEPPKIKKTRIPKIPNVEHILAVASGKGGVGKSTVSVNLAVALAESGKRVGLLDADIYGPSIPTMMNLHEKPLVNDKKFLIPLSNYGVKCMSIGFLIPSDDAAIWRGPMVMGALEQMLYQVEWGELDILVVDLPPGTGDAQLSLTQRTPLSGALIVSTPQRIALDDVKRGIKMFEKVNVPILGVIENMSYFKCDCGKEHHIFSSGGARKVAGDLGIEILDDIPIDINIRDSADSGKPVILSQSNSSSAEKYKNISRKVIEKLDNLSKDDTKIIMD